MLSTRMKEIIAAIVATIGLIGAILGILSYLQLQKEENKNQKVLMQSFLYELNKNQHLLYRFAYHNNNLSPSKINANINIPTDYLRGLTFSNDESISTRLRKKLIQQEDLIEYYNKRIGNFLANEKQKNGLHQKSYWEQKYSRIILKNYSDIACSLEKAYPIFRKHCHKHFFY